MATEEKPCKVEERIPNVKIKKEEECLSEHAPDMEFQVLLEETGVLTSIKTEMEPSFIGPEADVGKQFSPIPQTAFDCTKTELILDDDLLKDNNDSCSTIAAVEYQQGILEKNDEQHATVMIRNKDSEPCFTIYPQNTIEISNVFTKAELILEEEFLDQKNRSDGTSFSHDKDQRVLEMSDEHPRISIAEDSGTSKLCQNVFPKKSLEKRTYQCDSCPQSFVDKIDLRRHSSIHNDNSPRNFTCGRCNFMCLDVKSLKSHMNTHPEDRKAEFACQLCERRFYTRDGLTVHRRLHTGDTYNCELCGMRFTVKQTLQKHINRWHSAETSCIIQRYKCTHCDKDFGNKYLLVKHRTEHTGEPWKCRICEKKFTNRRRMPRKSDYRNEEELAAYVNQQTWSDSEAGDFTGDDSDIDPEFEFKAALRMNRDYDGDDDSDDDGDVFGVPPHQKIRTVVAAADKADVPNVASCVAVASSGNEALNQFADVEVTAVENGTVKNEMVQSNPGDDEPLIVGDASRWAQYATMFKTVMVDKDSDVFKKPLWHKQNLQLNKALVRFRGKDTLTPEIMALSTPFEFFSFFMTDDIISNLVQQSNLYSVQQASAMGHLDRMQSEGLQTTPDEMKRFLGINYFMSVVIYPSSRMYWSDATFFKPISESMPRNRYEKIRRYLHFNDNANQPRNQNRPSTAQQSSNEQAMTSNAESSTSTEPIARNLEMRQHNIETIGPIPQNDETYDRLYKLRPLIDALNRNFKKVPMKGRLCVDKQVCATKIAHFLFLLCDNSGFCYCFEIYSGDDDHRRNGEPNLGASANIVVRLARDIPRFVGHAIFFDNYYTSIPLLVYLRTQGIYSVGTIRRQRIPQCKLPQKLDNRGDSIEYVASFDGIDVSTVAWKDKKVVNMASTMAGIKPYLSTDEPAATIASAVQRFNKKTKSVESVECPNVIHEYNKYMAGVDLMDACLSRCRIRIKSRKWTHRLFYHMCDMAIINAWILYRRHFDCTVQTTKPLKLYEFIMEVATCLTKCGVPLARKPGRPSSLESEIATKRGRVNVAPLPPKDVRLDTIGHLPEHATTRHRCKKPGCDSRTRFVCRKCQVHLCLSSEKNCFMEFHTT